MSGNSTAKVGHWSTDEIKALSTRFQLSKSVRNEDVPKAEDALAVSIDPTFLSCRKFGTFRLVVLVIT